MQWYLRVQYVDTDTALDEEHPAKLGVIFKSWDTNTITPDWPNTAGQNLPHAVIIPLVFMKRTTFLA
jgi:hypothetical protein